jgi:hypothetical protein
MSFLLFLQNYLYNIDVSTIKSFLIVEAEKNNYIHNIVNNIEDQYLEINKEYNYVKVIEYYYGNIIIQFGTFIYVYNCANNNVNYKDNLLLPLYCDLNHYSINIPNNTSHITYNVTTEINCNNCNTKYIIDQIKIAFLENSMVII